MKLYNAQIVENDETILAATAIVHQQGYQPTRVVLRHVGGVQPFVTHLQTLLYYYPFEGQGYKEHVYWYEEDSMYGHYFADLEDAFADFAERARGNLPREGVPMARRATCDKDGTRIEEEL